MIKDRYFSGNWHCCTIVSLLHSKMELGSNPPVGSWFIFFPLGALAFSTEIESSFLKSISLCFKNDTF